MRAIIKRMRGRQQLLRVVTVQEPQPVPPQDAPLLMDLSDAICACLLCSINRRRRQAHKQWQLIFASYRPSLVHAGRTNNTESYMKPPFPHPHSAPLHSLLWLFFSWTSERKFSTGQIFLYVSGSLKRVKKRTPEKSGEGFKKIGKPHSF